MTLQFSLSSRNISVGGMASTQAELAEFICQLTRMLPVMPDVIAQGIEAQRAETGTVSVACDESPVGSADAPDQPLTGLTGARS